MLYFLEKKLEKLPQRWELSSQTPVGLRRLELCLQTPEFDWQLDSKIEMVTSLFPGRSTLANKRVRYLNELLISSIVSIAL